MEIDCSKFIQEFTNRTLSNYEYIKMHCTDTDEDSKKLYEVTQLINSMYGLLVVPEEIFGIKHYPDYADPRDYFKTEFSTREKNLRHYHKAYEPLVKSINTLKDNGCIKYPTIDQYVEDSPVCCFVYNMRNALCHDGIGFFPI